MSQPFKPAGNRYMKMFGFLAGSLLICLVSSIVQAKEIPQYTETEGIGKTMLDTVVVTGPYSVELLKQSSSRESIFSDVHRPLGIFSHFTWGADLGASIDMGGCDMSTFDADVFFGYKNAIIKTVGVGAGIHQAFGNGHNFIPVYAMFRSSFRRKPSLFFFDAKAGYSFNTISNSHSQGGIYGSVGIGINLAISKHFQSHIILSYGYFGMSAINAEDINYDGRHINYAQLRIGANF